jgi:hypothetical protein
MSSLWEMAWFSKPLLLLARIIIVSEVVDLPSATGIISPPPVTLVPLYVMPFVLVVHDRPPSVLRADPDPQAMMTSVPTIFGHALPHFPPEIGWLALTGDDQVTPSLLDVVSYTPNAVS